MAKRPNGWEDATPLPTLWMRDQYQLPTVADIEAWVSAQAWGRIVGRAGSVTHGLLATYIKSHSRANYVCVNPWLGDRSYVRVDAFQRLLPDDLRRMEQEFDQLQGMTSAGVNAKAACRLFRKLEAAA